VGWIRVAGVAAALALVAGCGDEDTEQACTDGAGGTALAYEARGASPAEVERAVDVICERLELLGVSDVALRSSGRRITAQIPRNADPTAVETAFSRDLLAFYDWEPNVVDPDTSEVLETDGAIGPEGSVITSRPIAGPTALYQAVTVASRAAPVAEETDIPPGGPDEDELREAGVDPGDERAVREFYDRRNDARPAAAVYRFGRDRQPIERGATASAGTETIEVPQGIVVLEAERSPGAPQNAPSLYFILEDDVELGGLEIDKPEQSTDRVTGEPVVTFGFTEQGAQAFKRVTARIAERGAMIVPPPPDIEQAFQRFAITLGNRIASIATINFRENPEGIDGSTGAQITNIGTPEQTKALASAVALGPLPVELELVSDG
jgi:SecD/SecF fusion protein